MGIINLKLKKYKKFFIRALSILNIISFNIYTMNIEKNIDVVIKRELFEAIKNYNIEKVRELLNQIANLLNLLDSTYEISDQKKFEAIADIINSKEEYEYTPLHWAAQKGDKAIVKLLISNGADIHAINSAGSIPLHRAVMHSDREMAQILIQAGSCVNLQDFKDYTSLHWATLRGCSRAGDTLILLIDNGVDIDRVTIEGDTALHFAATYNRQDMVQILLQAGANNNIKNNKNETATDVAKTQEIKDLIISAMYFRRR